MTDNSKPTSADSTAAERAPRLYVVGIGASAGGLDALRILFGSLPAAPGFACVIVVHLSPEHDSHLTELLQAYTSMPVQQVTETIALEPNRIYVIPPKANLDAIDTHLRLSPLERHRIERAPIDHFFRTLAQSHDGGGIGVVLTGAGSDGALGLRYIKERGGLTIAQTPAEAEYDSMPRNAISSGAVDLVLPLRDIAGEILRYCAAHPSLPLPDRDVDSEAPDIPVVEQIVSELAQRTGHDFSMFRRAALLQRIGKRMQLRHVETLGQYLQALRVLPEEVETLCSDLFTTASEFFADQASYELLECEVVPRLLERKTGRQDRVRAWVIGCSSGEAAYSVAILLREQAGQLAEQPELQVFASDPSRSALRIAREGLYAPEIAATVSPERLGRFFEPQRGYYRVRRELRDTVIFVDHNLFRDPPYSHLDLIVCRTLLQKLQPAIRRELLRLFAYSLEPHGLLLLGPSDVVDLPELFAPQSERPGLFRRVSGPVPRGLTLPSAFQLPQPAQQRREPEAGAVADIATIHRAAADRYMPPSVLIDGANQVVHYSAQAVHYVRMPGGEVTHDLLRLVAEPLRQRLRAAILTVRQTWQPWSSARFSMGTEGGAKTLRLRVDPAEADPSSGMLLVVFDDQTPEQAAVKSGTGETGLQAAATVASLEAELEQANCRLHALLFPPIKLDGVPGREEVQQADEQLQAIVEELERSREELQALNAALTSFFDENRRRLDELAQTSTDLQHLLDAAGIATLFIDCSLNLMRFTPRLGELFNVRAGDIGRPVSDLTRQLYYPELEADARRVLEHNTPVEREVAAFGGRWYLSRLLPYRTAAKTLEGVVLTLIDITERHRAEMELREADRRKDEFLAILGHELRNPLAPISSGIEILRGPGGNKPHIVAQVVATMGRQTHQLVRLVEDLLDVSRISRGTLQLHRAPVELSEVIRDAVSAVQPLITQSEHELAILEDDKDIVLEADAARLTQVLGNLLSNAARYTPRGGRIALRSRREGDEAVIAIQDNGFGISSKALGRVFEMFYQGDDARLPRNLGIGIGLTLTKTLVELHGGSISVSSAGVDRGSEFTVRLRVSKLTVADLGRLETGLTSMSGTADQRILIVDDNADAAQTLGMLVQALGSSEVQTASSGAQALKTAAEMHPDIVLLDLTMPEMDGFEVARRMRGESWGKDLMLVALTGWGQEEHRRRSKEAGFDRHITKPADLAAIQSILSTRHAASENSL